MIISASQPTFLPYPGYFGLINFVDKFVIMDNIQFDSRSWQQRVLIRAKNSPQYISVPVKKKNLSKQIIMNTKIDVSSKYIKDHLLTIKHNYSKFPYFDKFYPEIENIYLKKFDKLIDLNLSFIFLIMKILKINSDKILLLSNLEIEEKFTKANLIYEICSKLQAESYITTIGAKLYIDHNKKLNNDYDIRYFKYEDKYQKMYFNSEICYLSIIDLLFKYGDDMKKIIQSNFSVPINEQSKKK